MSPEYKPYVIPSIFLSPFRYYMYNISFNKNKRRSMSWPIYARSTVPSTGILSHSTYLPKSCVINSNQQIRAFPFSILSPGLTVTSCHFFRVFTDILTVLEQVSSNTSFLNGFYSLVTTDYYRGTARLILHPIYRLISTHSLWNILSEKDRYILLYHNACQSEWWS